MDGPVPGRLTFAGRGVRSAFELRAIALAPGCERAYDEGEWCDALVVVERGEIELEGVDGSRRRFARGGVLCLSGVALRALRNRGSESALLVAVSRRPRPSTPGTVPERGLSHR